MDSVGVFQGMGNNQGQKSSSSAHRQVQQLSKWLDAQFRLPNGWQFGWDGLLGLIPGVGDLLTSLMSFYILLQAARLGCPPSVILRMGLNVLIDNILDAIPFIGNLFDFVRKSNSRNLALLESYMVHPHSTVRTSRFLVVLSLLIAVGLFLVAIATSYWVLVFVWEYLRELF